MKGISLIELLVYVSCSAILMSLTLYTAFSLRQVSVASIRSAQNWVQLGCALQRMVDDIRTAKATDWKARHAQSAVFSLLKKDCGWMKDKKRLIRVTGTYGRSAGVWNSRAVSVIIDAIEDLLFQYKYSANRLVGVKIKLMIDKNCFLETFVSCG
jgi:hypothetical protein